MISSPNQSLPDLLPARMLNELTYCPRLFFYEHVEGLFAHNQETVEGTLRHSTLDEREDSLPPPEELAESGRTVRSRSVTLSSEMHGVIAKMDLIEVDQEGVTPVDYKRGRPREGTDRTIEAWDPDRVQMAVQSMILREQGYRCDEAIVYYVATKQRVRIRIDSQLVEQALNAIRQARQIAADGQVPPPLVDSPKCPRCSLVGICLPDETNLCSATQDRPALRVQKTLFDVEPKREATLGGEADRPSEVRRLVPARDDLRPLYLNTQGLYVGKSGEVLKVKDKDRLVQEVRLNEICQLNLLGNIQLTTQAIQALCEAEIPIAYFSMGGWFYGITQALGVKNIFLRREQFRFAEVPGFCLRLARALVAGKIANQRTLLQRNHVEPPTHALALMKCLQQDAEHAVAMESLLGIEGNAARIYFEHFAGMLKGGDPGTCEVSASEGDEPVATSSSPANGTMSFDFTNRNRRPPRDPVNALLSLAYSVLAKDLMIVTQAVGFDPYLGFYHQPRFGRASLALDLMEPFRPLIADSAVLSAINTRMVTASDFVRTGNAVALTAGGRKKFFRAYEQRMDTLVTHPMFGYRVNYRRMLDIQARLLARLLTGELTVYPVFTTR